MLYSNTTGHNNTAKDVNALRFSRTGTAIHPVGFQPSLAIVTGSANTAIGDSHYIILPVQITTPWAFRQPFLPDFQALLP